MKTLAIIILLASTSFAVPPKALEYDFDPPAFPTNQQGQIFHHFLPARDNFTANVNLIAQPYEDTLEAYDQLSRGQFEQIGIKLITAKINDGVLTYEYEGKMQGIDLRWYSRAIKQGDTIYLITATGLADRWEEDGPKLIASVNSFVLK